MKRFGQILLIVVGVSLIGLLGVAQQKPELYKKWFKQERVASSPKAVQYSYGATEPNCTGADKVSTYESGDTRIITCNWHCARHKENAHAWVNIKFLKEAGGDWQKQSEFVTDGHCT